MPIPTSVATEVRSRAQGKGRKKIHRVMGEFKRGALRSSSGQKVTGQKQAIAIAMSEARRVGAKIPKPSKPKQPGKVKKQSKTSTLMKRFSR